MNIKLILVVIVITGLCSCSSAYKIQQTPDDVYYSPAPKQGGYVQAISDKSANVYTTTLPEDQEILIRVRSHRWRRIHRYDYDYPYGYGYYPYENNPVYIDPKTTGTPAATYTAPRKYNLDTYKPNNGTGVGNFMRRLFNSPNSNIVNDNPNTNQGRSYQPATNSTRSANTSSTSTTRSSTGSSSGGSAPVRSFHR